MAIHSGAFSAILQLLPQLFFSYCLSYSSVIASVILQLLPSVIYASTLQRMIRSLPLGSAGISSTHSKW